MPGSFLSVPEQYAYTQYAKHGVILQKKLNQQRVNSSVYHTILKTEEKFLFLDLLSRVVQCFGMLKSSHSDVLLQLHFLTSTCRNTPTQTQTLHWQFFFTAEIWRLCVMSVSCCSFHLFVIWSHMTHMTNKKYSMLL